jgi:hypothetical protein
VQLVLGDSSVFTQIEHNPGEPIKNRPETEQHKSDQRQRDNLYPIEGAKPVAHCQEQQPNAEDDEEYRSHSPEQEGNRRQLVSFVLHKPPAGRLTTKDDAIPGQDG